MIWRSLRRLVPLARRGLQRRGSGTWPGTGVGSGSGAPGDAAGRRPAMPGPAFLVIAGAGAVAGSVVVALIIGLFMLIPGQSPRTSAAALSPAPVRTAGTPSGSSGTAPSGLTRTSPMPTGLTPTGLTPTGGLGPPTPTPVPQTPAQQARALDALLSSSAAGRSLVPSAVTSLARCDSAAAADAAGAVRAIQKATDTRRQLLASLERARVDALPGGQNLASLLGQAWEQSLAADEHYLTWASSIASGTPCNPQDPFKIAGDVASGAARRARQDFVDVWNPTVARPQHLRTRGVEDV